MTILVTSADLPSLLEAAAKWNIRIRNIQKADILTARLEVFDKDYPLLLEITKKRGDECVLLKGTPVSVRTGVVMRRWVLAVACVMLFVATLWIPGRIFFVRVEGNSRLPKASIMLAAEECGVYFGADRRLVRSVKIKNALLQRLPELGWACINTSGCVATIRVSEKTESEDIASSEQESTCIYAAKDGLVYDLTVYSGFPQVNIGHAVKKGQILISGKQQDGILVRNVRASGDVYATTATDVTAAFVTKAAEKTAVTESHRNFRLIIGKKLVNFMKDSRICTPGCDKILTRHYFTLPGGFALPLGVITETCMCYDVTVCDYPYEHQSQMAETYMRRYISQQIIAGRVVRQEHLAGAEDYYNRLSVRFHCVEMIGREGYEEIESSYGEND